MLTNYEALNCDFYDFLHFSKAEICQISKIHRMKNGKIGNFKTSKFSKIGFTENLNEKKILKPPHHVQHMQSCIYLATLPLLHEDTYF